MIQITEYDIFRIIYGINVETHKDIQQHILLELQREREGDWYTEREREQTLYTHEYTASTKEGYWKFRGSEVRRS